MNNTNYNKLGENMNDELRDLLRRTYVSFLTASEEHECTDSDCSDCTLLLDLERQLGITPKWVEGICTGLGYRMVERVDDTGIDLASMSHSFGDHRYLFTGGSELPPCTLFVLGEGKRLSLAFDVRDGCDHPLNISTLKLAGRLLLRQAGMPESAICVDQKTNIFSYADFVWVEVKDA